MFKNTNLYLFFCVTVVLGSSCKSRSADRDFRRFVRQFKEVSLPMDTILDRVYNNPHANQRIDTAFVRFFIKKDYTFDPYSQMSHGYSYFVRLPDEEFNYFALIYLYAGKEGNTFVLKTYKLNGKPVSKLLLSADYLNSMKVRGVINEKRQIKIVQYWQDSTSVNNYFLDAGGKIVKMPD